MNESTQTQASQQTAQTGQTQTPGTSNENSNVRQEPAGTEKGEQKSILERAEEMKNYIDQKEKDIMEKIERFENRIATSLLSGRNEIIPTMSQAERDKNESEKIVDRYFGK